MNAYEGENNVKPAGQSCDPLDKIMVSLLQSKVNPFHRA
jgi:hypothetical protein